MPPTRPSIMSDGAMTSQPASRLGQRLLAQHLEVSSLTIVPSAEQPVMAMAGIGIERHVADDADAGIAA
jgi:hypothetical protein